MKKNDRDRHVPLLTKAIRIMKVTSLCNLLAVCSISASTYAQSLKFSIHKQNSSISEVFKEIEKKSDFTFFFNDNQINVKQKVNVSANNANIEDVLAQVLQNTGYDYQIIDKQILIKVSDKDVMVVPSVAQSSKRITGIVLDATGMPVIGANVMEKGTTNGTITDMDGKFSLNVEKGATLVVSYIGFSNQEIKIGNQTNLSITMKEDAEALDELVVVGYGVQKKANLSGAVETVSSTMLQNRATNNVGIALQGLVPNLQISPNGGSADAVPSFNVRGETSINGGAPLILVDGIPTSAGDFARINSMDIENISVLKDASSAAIYGARASFGVILVTTKKGKSEKLQVQFNNTYNVRKLTNMPKVVKDPYIQASYKKEMGKPWYDLYSDEEVEYAQKLLQDPSLESTIINQKNPNSYTYLASTDWFDEIFDKLGTSHQHNLSVSGASEKASYYLGTEYYAESGLLHYNKDQYSRFNVRSNVEYRPFNRLTVANNTAFTYYKYDKPNNFGS